MTTATIDPSRLNNPHEVPRYAEWMTRGEWETRFPDEFVAVVDPEFDETKDVDITGGFVVGHSTEEVLAFAELNRLNPKHSAVRYTGGPEENMEYLL